LRNAYESVIVVVAIAVYSGRDGEIAGKENEERNSRKMDSHGLGKVEKK